jgi:hypothetical protein
MNSPREPDPSNPNDLSYYAPPQLRERAKSVSFPKKQDRSPLRPQSPSPLRWISDPKHRFICGIHQPLRLFRRLLV